MNNISVYLGKYSNVGLKQNTIKELFTESIRENCNLEIEKEKISIGNNSIKINVQGSAKAEIFMKLENIQKTFLEKLSKMGDKMTERKVF